MGEKIPEYFKYLVGLSVIVLIVVCLIGPMFLFSSFNFLGELNPVSKAELDFSLEIIDSQSQNNLYKLFSTNSIQKKNETLSLEFYSLMGFQDNIRTKSNQAD